MQYPSISAILGAGLAVAASPLLSLPEQPEVAPAHAVAVCVADVVVDTSNCDDEDAPFIYIDWLPASQSCECPPLNCCHVHIDIYATAEPGQRVGTGLGAPCTKREITVPVKVDGCGKTKKTDIVVKKKHDCDLICIATVEAVCSTCGPIP